MGINNYKKPLNSGFTLVELSISLVIIGLITAGIMTGQKLVQNSKLQNVIKELREYDTAISQFKDKFRYYPGDFPNATTYWSSSTAPNASNTKGNWRIETGTTTSTAYEDLCFWQQLALAQFIPGTYNATTGTTSATRNILGTNSPKSIIPGGGYQVLYASSYYATTGNLLMLGSLSSNSTGYIDGKILNTSDAYLIDTKIDDGFAASGNLYTARANGVTTCVSAAYNAATATYTMSNSTVSCRIFWWLDKNK